MITIHDAPNAGADAAQNICNDSAAIVDLAALLTADADAGGVWSVTSGTADAGAFDAAAATFNPLNHSAANLVFTYTVQVLPRVRKTRLLLVCK